MKHDEVPKTPHSTYMDLVSERLNILKMSVEEMNDYLFYRKQRTTERLQFQAATEKEKEEGLQQGLKKGLKTGRKEEKIKIAKGMLAKNYPIEDIADLTQLSIQEIHQLKQ